MQPQAIRFHGAVHANLSFADGVSAGTGNIRLREDSVYIKSTAPRSIGGILDDGIKIYRDAFANSWPLALCAQLVLSVPALIMQYKFGGVLVAGGNSQAALSIFKSPVVWLPYLVGVIVFFGFYNALIVQLNGIATADIVPRGRSLAVGFRLLPRTLLLFIVMFTAFMVAGALVGVVAGILGGLHLSIVVGILVVAFAVIAIYVWGRAFLSNIALVVEDGNVFRSLKISWTLIRNHWWRAATVYSIALILVMAFYVVVAVVNAALAGARLRSPFGMGAILSQLLSIVGGAVLMSFIPAVLLAMYHDLKLRKEGADLASQVNALAPQ
jgi:hypothetical protein